MAKYTLTSPEAVCNDGTPAILYMRRSVAGAMDGASQPVDNKWIIHLQEGGGCLDYGQCLARWCGLAGYDASKMSSRYAPASMGGQGLFLRDASNQFGNYNQVYVYYCSSDNWTGAKTDSVAVDPSGAGKNFRMQVNGSRIVDAVFNELRGGLRNAQGQQIMPPLDQATHVYLTGSSAGSHGARHNADRMGALLRQRAPSAGFAVLSDAALSATYEGVSGLPLGNPGDPYTQLQQFAYSSATSLWGARYDESCLSLNALNPWLCADVVYVSQNHITTPLFNRTDLLDPNVLNNVDPAIIPTTAEFARNSHDRMSRFLLMRQLSPERAQMTRDPGSYGPMCGVHITMDARSFYEKHVRLNGVPVSFYEILWNWVSNNGGPVVARRDKPGLTPPAPAFDAECNDTSGPPRTPVATVNAASFATGQPVAPGAIVSAFGSNFAPETALATALPLPTRLLGSGVGIRDSAGARRAAQLLAITPTQVNFIVPEGLAAGAATVIVENGESQSFTGMVEIAPVAPGLFSANQSGSGAPAGVWERVSGNGQRGSGPLNVAATAVPAPIELGGPTDQVFLTLYGTGFRQGTQGQVRIGGVPIPVQYAGAQGSFAGLDQLNIGPIPRSLAGRANVELEFVANGRTANRLTVSFQ